MRLEDLDVLASDHGPPDAPDQLFAFSRKHHAGNDFDPTGAGAVEHERCRLSGVRCPGGGAGAWHPTPGTFFTRGEGEFGGGGRAREITHSTSWVEGYGTVN